LFVTYIEQHLSALGHNVDDSVAADQINKFLSGHYATVREEPVTHHSVLEINLQQSMVASNPLLKRYEYM
jgi:hypothetical protein